MITSLVRPGILTLEDAVAKMTANPASGYGLSEGTLSVGSEADITVIDTEASWQVDANAFKSKSRNTPFHGWTYTGVADLTVLGGRITHQHRS